MKNPEPYDSSNFIDNHIGKQKRDDFASLFSRIYKKIDIERAMKSFRRGFEDSEEPKHILFRAVVDGFSPKDAAGASDSGFETTIVNPLYEQGQTGAEVLLAKKQPSGVDLCFVSVNVSREGEDKWRDEINQIQRVLEEDDNRSRLLRHIKSSGLRIKSVQYVTLTRDIDMVDIDGKRVQLSTNPDSYAIWTLIQADDFSPDNDAGCGDGSQEIVLEEGKIEHPDLERICTEGVDPTLADNDDIKYSLTTHPVYPIGEVCMTLFYKKEGSDSNSKEFTREEFESVYEESIKMGYQREGAGGVLSDTIDDLLEKACNWGILKEGEEVEDGDYRILWETGEGADIKDSVKEKYYKHKAPDEMGYLAFEKARDAWDHPDSSIDEFV